MNTIYNLEDKIIGQFKNGVAWTKSNRVRLGEYDDDFVYCNDKTVLAKICDDEVVDIIGDTIGAVSGRDLILSGEKVGHFIGSKSAGDAAIVLLFSQYATQTHIKE